MAFRVNDVPSEENYENWKKAIAKKELEIADLHRKNQLAMTEWMASRGKPDEKKYVTAYNTLQCGYQLARQELAELKKGT